ncbi:MAG: hypothetical protein PHC61_15880, partial [Chitinivibrionales bacterium]|nr:hypothetical protein [Chitinivibrionales bacterium]
MKNKVILLCTALFLGFGCAPYQQLKPKVELSNAEQGYNELKKDKNDFELKKNTMYFIAFPAPREDHFYLVLTIPEKKKLGSSFTNSLKNKKIVGPLVADESPVPESTSVYAMDTKSPTFYWLTGKLTENLVLKIKYRYVPQWRFKFETKHAEYQKIFKENIVDRGAYTGIGSSTKLEGFNFTEALDTVGRHLKEIDKVHAELLAIENIFPPSILNSQDKAYQDFKALRGALENEYTFQKNYCTALDFFKKESALKGNPAAFFAWLDGFITYFTQKNDLPPNVVAESRAAIKARLGEVLPFLISTIAAKEGTAPFDAERHYLNYFDRIKKLSEKADLAVPQQFTDL